MEVRLTRIINKIGNSCRIRTIPPQISEALDLKDGQEVEFEVKKGKIIITPTSRIVPKEERKYVSKEK